MGHDEIRITRRHLIVMLGGASSIRMFPTWAAQADCIAPQPYFASVKRALEALEKLGAPIGVADAQRISALAAQGDSGAVGVTEKILERYTIANVSIESETSAHVAQGGASGTLVEQGWRVFLLRVANPAGGTGNVLFSAPASPTYGPSQMGPSDHSAQRAGLADRLNKAPDIEKMWLLSQLYETTPVLLFGQEMPVFALSGSPIEYRVIQLYSRDRGPHRAELMVHTVATSGGGLAAYGHREFDFDCLPSRAVTLGVVDVDGRGCVAALTIKDKLDHIYPPQAMRLAPDMFFQPQIYRADGETIRLPDGEYSVEVRRGPEYLRTLQTATIDANRSRIDVNLQRWIDPSKWGWYSGDTHIHAGGCAHYQNPTEGVSPETMIRHVRGEGLSVGDVLTWGPSWYFQKQFFTGRAESPPAKLEHPELQQANGATLEPHTTPEDPESVLRYDVEVSQFPSSHAGHLVLLRLRDQDYPGTKLIEDWPSWNLPILKWVKAQGALGGYAHCGIGMVVDSTDLPNYEIPPMDGIGTQEAIMDVTHGVCDFLSGANTHPIAELNAWYHMLNCGFRMAMVGETDWPCITGDRVGVGRSYVRLDHRPADDSGYEAWVRGLKDGRLYCGDGRSHFLEFKVNGHRAGDKDLELSSAQTVHVEAIVAARLEPEITLETTPKRILPGWGWHLEWARVGTTRAVPVELVVNGIAVEKTSLLADGAPRPLKFKTPIARSSWVALRIMPSAHTHPVFVTVAGKPIRASKRSAQWCRTCIDKVWEVKSPFMREIERPAAAEAFDHARRTYDKITSESETA
jgi:hypothetical protein